MRTADTVRLLLLAVIWSASFVFIRVLAPVLGPVWVATSRVLIAGIALTGAFVALRRHLDVALHWREYLFVGVLNSALPFLLFAYTAYQQHLKDESASRARWENWQQSRFDAEPLGKMDGNTERWG